MVGARPWRSDKPSCRPLAKRRIRGQRVFHGFEHGADLVAQLLEPGACTRLSLCDHARLLARNSAASARRREPAMLEKIARLRAGVIAPAEGGPHEAFSQRRTLREHR